MTAKPASSRHGSKNDERMMPRGIFSMPKTRTQSWRPLRMASTARPRAAPPLAQPASTFMIGVTFGAGWSPCVGPILGAILTMAAGRGESGAAAALLTAYAFGLGLPFIATALAFGSAPGILRRINRRLHAVTSVSGGVMVAMGAILLLGIYQRVFTELIAAAPWMPWEPNV